MLVELFVVVNGLAEYKGRISSKGQVVIPKEIREKYGFREGVEVVFRPYGRYRIIIERQPRLSELFGFLGDAEASKVLEEERRRDLGLEVERDRELEASHG